MRRILYADTSALARVYLADEPDSDDLRELLLESGEAVLTSELARVELARAAQGAERAGRIEDASALLAEADADIATSIALVDLDPSRVLPSARNLVLSHPLGTLDAIHIAVALEESRRSTDPILFVTRDRDQAAAASAVGLALG